MVATTHLELHSLRGQLREIYEAISTFGATQLAVKPPILESSIDLNDGGVNEEFHSHQDAVKGLRALRDSIRRDLDVLEKFLDDPQCARQPSLSTNAPYLISVWNEVLHAPPPIVTIMRTFVEGDRPTHVPRRGSKKPPGIKVDVVADGGKRWIRVNTTKNSRLLAEFREIDSYMTDSEDEDGRPSLAQKEFDNSILKMGRTLLDAARRNPVPDTAVVPEVTMRLTRLDPCPSNPNHRDPRIAQTIDMLRDMGITVELGERDPALLPKVSPVPVRRLEPTICVNLDLSLLIALVSDITHSSLPSSVAEADTRYVPSAHYREWKRKRLEATKGADEENDGERLLVKNGIGEHSRALANQALQEMSRGLLQDIRDRLAAVPSEGLASVEFWTTPEARDRCLRIVLSKIGGPREKRRAAALFPSSDVSVQQAEDEYWEGSRYPRAFLPLIPIRILPSSAPPEDVMCPAQSEDGRALSPFFPLLARTCRDILAQETIPNPTPPSLSATSVPASTEDGMRENNAEEQRQDIERAATMKASPRLTEHTVQSMLWGAVRGWTTLTANKSSVKAILRDIRTSEGGYGWTGHSREGGDDTAEVATDGEEAVVVEKAAMWVVDPRSLAEGMRADFSE